MNRERLLAYARGLEPKQSHLVLYHVEPDTGDVVIHSCKTCLGDDMWIRVINYAGEVDVPDEAIEAKIKAYENNK